MGSITPSRTRAFMRRIKERRETCGISQGEASRRAGWHRANWQAVESGRNTDPHFDTVAHMASVVGARLELVCDPPAPDEVPHLDRDEWRAIASLAQWYVARRDRSRLPLALDSAARKLERFARRFRAHGEPWRPAVSALPEIVPQLVVEREARGLSQRRVAEHGGLNSGVVSRLENGATDAQFWVVERYAAGLGYRIVLMPAEVDG